MNVYLNEPDVVSESTTKARLIIQPNGVVRYNPTIVNVDNAPVMLDGTAEEIGLALKDFKDDIYKCGFATTIGPDKEVCRVVKLDDVELLFNNLMVKLAEKSK